MAINLEGGGGKALMAWPLVEELFFSASHTLDIYVDWENEDGAQKYC